MRFIRPMRAFPRFLGLLLLMQAVVPAAGSASVSPAASAVAPAKGTTAAADGAGEGFSIVQDEKRPEGEVGCWHRLAAFAGRLHPALTHFPVAWILLAAGFEWAALLIAWRHSGAYRLSFQDHREGLEQARRLGMASLILLFLAAFSSLAAAGSGYLLSLTKEPEAALTWHGRLAYATVALGMLALGARLVSRKRGSRAWRLASALLLAAAAGTVGYAGHLGGSLVYGEGYPITNGDEP